MVSSGLGLSYRIIDESGACRSSSDGRKPKVSSFLYNLKFKSIRNIDGVSGRPESGRGGMRSWMQARAVPAVSTRIAGLVGLFRSPLKPGTKNSIPTNFSVASLLIECC